MSHGCHSFLNQARNLSASVQANLSQLVQPTLDYLLSLQFHSGNFPSSLESGGRDRLVQWCHGAPGFVHLLGLAHQVGYTASYWRMCVILFIAYYVYAGDGW